MGVRGLLNIQFARTGDKLYVLEANPRASRTVPFVSKATGVPLAKAAARIAVGESIAGLRVSGLLPAIGDGAELPVGAAMAVDPVAGSYAMDGGTYEAKVTLSESAWAPDDTATLTVTATVCGFNASATFVVTVVADPET